MYLILLLSYLESITMSCWYLIRTLRRKTEGLALLTVSTLPFHPLSLPLRSSHSNAEIHAYGPG